MINGEGWMENGITCDVDVIKVNNWTHKSNYSLPVKPSPNLPNERSINLYPSLCLFEGTVVSIGRGTAMPFQVIGHPNYTETDFSFTPFSTIGATYPKFENTKCYGIDLREGDYLNELRLTYLIQFYKNLKDKEVNFFNAYFTLLAGTSSLQKQIEDGWSEDQIRSSWQDELNEFKAKREKYLLYP
jgi:uncharacterized protein YbbC (DUF1343 family)